MDYVLTTNALSKTYGSFRALDSVSMHIPKGAIYGIVGKNGAGKTTLFRLICGLQTTSAGEYTLYGRNSTDRDLRRSRRRMGAVVETPSIYPDMTAEENLKQQYRILGLPTFEGLADILRLVGLEHAGKKKARHFSLGMRQRLGIAIALCGDPDFLVLDEPVNGLDPQGIIQIRELILKLNREHQITFLISSHILDELARLATHYGFIDNGCIVKEISAAELEAACSKCMRLQVTSTRSAAAVLDRLGLEYSILSDTLADIYGDISITTLAIALHDAGCDVISFHERNESLESYYVKLIGGGSHV